ncbi:hypothetical protein Tco_1008847 [Tanacetum coccineum]
MASIFGSKSRSLMTMSIPPQDEPSISQPVKYDDSSEEELEEDENVVIGGSEIMRKQLEPRKDSEGIRGIRNFTRRIKGMHIFVGNFTYVLDFMIIGDISSIIDPRLSQVHMKSVYLRNEEDKRKGVEYVMSKILGFYKECLEPGPEYLTGLEDEGGVTSTALMIVATTQNTNNTTIKLILLAEKLTGSNFTNWYCNLRIVLRYEKKLKFVEQPIGPAPDLETADPDTIDKYYESVNLEQEVACLMLLSMSPDLQMTL